MHNVELHDLYCLSCTRIMKEHWQVVEECGMHGTEGDLQQIFDWKT